MARATRTSNPVSLFPFLAVLMCTIGALILLLVGVSAQIRKNAVETAQREQAPVVAPFPDEPPEPETQLVIVVPPPVEPEPVATPEPPPVPRATAEDLARVEELAALSQQLGAELLERSSGLSAAQRASAELRDKLRLTASQEQRLAGQIQQAQAESATAAQRIQAGRQEQQAIEELILESDDLIRQREQELSSPRFSIVPYDGQTGTIRRPIVIECKEDSLRFVAENITLDPSTLDGYTPDQNPLLSGILVLADYWAETDRASGDGRVLRPYPLLLVRPDGAESFEAARVLLDRLTGNYGYELIEDEFDFKPPATTDEAITRCREAIQTAYELKPQPVIKPPPPQAVDSGFVRRTPAAASSFFKSNAFKRRGAGSGDGTGGARPNGNGSRAGVRPGTDDSMPGLLASQPVGPGSGPSGSKPVPGSRPSGAEKPGGTGKAPGSPGQSPQRLPFDLINPPSRPGRGGQGSSPSEQASNGQSGSAPAGSVSGSANDIGASGGQSPGRGRKRWGLSKPNASLELEQKVTLIVRSEQIAVDGKYAVSRKSAGTSIEMVNRTVLALEQVAREWGQPPERFFWVPSVTLGVSSDAAELGLLLARTLRKEGLEVKVVDVK